MGKLGKLDCPFCEASKAMADGVMERLPTVQFIPSNPPMVEEHLSWIEVQAALSHALEALKAVLPAGHDGDEKSCQCDEDCQRCTVDAAMAHISSVLEKGSIT